MHQYGFDKEEKSEELWAVQITIII
jgi:hypothetical protein